MPTRLRHVPAPATPRATLEAVALAAVLALLGPDVAAQVNGGRYIGSTLPSASDLRRVAIDPTLLHLVAALDSPAFAERETATQQILAGWEDPLQIFAVLDRQQLSAEQRHRLLVIARSKILDRARGALGITMTPVNNPQPGAPVEIRVDRFVAGLPAERVLELRDIIYEVDGQPFRRSQELVDHVQNMEPGEAVRLSVRRVARDEDGEPRVDAQGKQVYEELKIDLVLGDAELLNDRRTGRQAESSVVMQRQANAMAAVGRWSKSVPVPVDDELIGVNATPMRPGTLSQRQMQDQRSLERMLERLENGPLPQLDGQLNANNKWEQLAAYLQVQSRRPDLTPEERAEFRRALRGLLEFIDTP